MKVLIVGSGGREHALAWKVAQSKLVKRVYVAPGNAGTATEPRMQNVEIHPEDIHELAKFATCQRIDLTIIGAETPLVMGVVDLFAQHDLRCFGPRRAAAQLEGSKTFAKDFLKRHAIPTAESESFRDLNAAHQFLDSVEYPLVIKADGLAAGKGVVIAENRHQAATTLTDMLEKNRYGEAANCVLIEQFLRGEEVSFICMVDGKSILPMASSQDHKAAHDLDTGPNTGGMGAYSPAPIVDDEMHARIMDMVIRPTVEGLATANMPYTGFLYAGLMIDKQGTPNVLEFNCRLGDPETQPILLRMRSDLVAHCLSALAGNLADQRIEWDCRPALGVVMAAAGYPGPIQQGSLIHGLAQEELQSKSSGSKQKPAPQKVFHAGTKLVEGKLAVSGGRVVCVTASGDTVREAQQTAYQLAKRIHWQGCWYRTDIGHRAIAREMQNEPQNPRN